MDRPALIFICGLIGGVYLWFFAILVWGIWIHRYVETSNLKPAPFSLTLFTGVGILMDYRKARLIAAQRKHKPWFLWCFEWLTGLGMVGLTGTIAYMLITTL